MLDILAKTYMISSRMDQFTHASRKAADRRSEPPLPARFARRWWTRMIENG